MRTPFSRVALSLVVFLSFILLARGEEQATDEHAADVTDVLQWLSNNANDTMDRLSQFLSIPSVSTDPSHRTDVRRAANWLLDELSDAGLENGQLLESQLHPTVYADWLHASDTAPTVLFYAHYDVQPEDPVALWKSPPFEPTIRDGCIYARGASDDKGYLFVVLTVLRAFLKLKGKLPVNVKVIFEGEEEISSPNFSKILSDNAKLLSADVAFSADGGQRSTKIPVLLVGLRGYTALEVFLTTAKSDMHSGTFGGGVQNPIHALVQLLDTLHDSETGKILVPSYYDDVDEPSNADRDDIAVYPFPAEDSLTYHGVNTSVGEEGFNFFERTWIRPTVEVVGISGGYQAEGIKNVLPHTASAKLTFRLVPNQSPQKVLSIVSKFLENEAAKIPGVNIKINKFDSASEPFTIARNAPGNSIARSVLRSLYGAEPFFTWNGGSIAALALLQQKLSLDTTVFAFGFQDENVHAPNEFTRIAQLRFAERAYTLLLAELESRWQTVASTAKEEL